ncbi:MAG: hypothetical protein P9L99_15160 [Candidatus Lernaella stagnicola]|nr:hypothetical protein [Candidatus Lernaella stagnicola]
MKRLLLATVGLLLVSVMIYTFGCGDTDPATAPAGASVFLVGFDEDPSLSFQCDADWDIPSPCFDIFRQYCISACVIDFVGGNDEIYSNGQRDEFDDCVFDAQTCADSVCDDKFAWITTCELDDTRRSEAKNFIRSAEGKCGFVSYLISAVVQGPASLVIAEGSEEVTDPLNGVEVRWTVAGGELYLPADIPGDVPPLSNPFYDESNDRGISETKYRIAVPNQCGAEVSYSITASIGVAADTSLITLTVADSENTDVET